MYFLLKYDLQFITLWKYARDRLRKVLEKFKYLSKYFYFCILDFKSPDFYSI